MGHGLHSSSIQRVCLAYHRVNQLIASVNTFILGINKSANLKITGMDLLIVLKKFESVFTQENCFKDFNKYELRQMERKR